MQPRQQRLLLQVGAFAFIIGIIYFTYTGGQHQIIPAAGKSALGQSSTKSTSPPKSSSSRPYLFIFGDSYSSHSHAGFVPSAPLQPTEENPTGYLPANKDEGTFSGGDIWVDIYLKNAPKGTFVHNYATPGNVVNYTRLGTHFDPLLMAIVSPVKDMVTQLEHFETIHSKTVPWKGDNSVFFNWFGVNDLTATQLHSKLPQDEMELLIEAQVGDFWTLVRRQYAQGARNFVHMLVPPMERVPSYADFNPAMKPLAQHLTKTWSDVFRKGNKDFLREHPEATSIVFETAEVFNEIMDHYKEYGARNDNCFSYGKDTLCLWYDFLHPGELIQREMGKRIFEKSKKIFGL